MNLSEEILRDLKTLHEEEAQLAMRKANVYARALGAAPSFGDGALSAKKKKGRKARAPGEPASRAPSGYNLFAQKQHKKGDLPKSGTMAEIGARWKAVGESGQKKYQGKAAKARESWQAERDAWIAAHPPPAALSAASSPAGGPRAPPPIPASALEATKKRKTSVDSADPTALAPSEKKKKKKKSPPPPPPAAAAASSSTSDESSSSSSSDSDSD